MLYRSTMLWISLLICAVMANGAYAQATRTWVSGVGDDANPCSRTAPCKTYAGAISKTAAGGEISTLDPGGFGSVTITKSITISGDGQLAGILNAGTNGITINAGASDVIILRSLSIAGAGSGTNGINYLAGGSVLVDNVSICCQTLAGINVSLSASGSLAVRNSTINGGTNGIKVNGTAGTVNVSVDHVTIKGASNAAIDAVYGNTDVQYSTIAQNSGYGLYGEGGSINIDNSQIIGNGTALMADTGSTIRITNNSFYDNGLAFACGSGTLASAGNNRKGNNTGGSGTVCPPNGTINQQ